MKLPLSFKNAGALTLLFFIGLGTSLSFQNCTKGFEGVSDTGLALGPTESSLLRSNSSDLDALAQARLTSGATSVPKVGIAYMIWHCMANDPNRNKVISQAVQTGAWGRIPEFHWRDVPAATNSISTYCATNKDLIRKHFEMLEAAKVDFLVVDFTNQSYTPGGPFEVAPQSMIDGFKNLLDVSVERGGKIKVVPWVSFKGNLHTHLLKMMGLFPLQNPNPYEQAVFLYQGKPLIIASWDTGRQQEMVEPAIATVEAAGIKVRKMWALHKGTLKDAAGSPVWSFMEQCQPGFREAQGNMDCGQYTHPELASVSAAYQETFMTDFRTAVPKFSGRTFMKQMKTAQSSGAPLIVLNTWNEWIAQRFCLKDNLPTHLCYANDGSPINEQFPFNGRPVFVDAFDREYSRDLEPDTVGSEYYVLMMNAIASVKGVGSGTTCTAGTQASCPITNGTGQKTCNASGTGYGSCTVVSCNPGYTVSNGQCVISPSYSEVKTVTASVGGVPGQTGTWWCENHFTRNYGGTWVCLDNNCAQNATLNQVISCGKLQQACSPNSSTSCAITNGAGQKTCNSTGSAYGSCVATSCNAGYTLNNGQCVMPQACSPNSSTSCSITNGIGQKTCNSPGSAYGSCVATSCNSGYTLSNGQCMVQQVCSPNSSTSCAITNGVGQKTCNSAGSAYGSCVATSCNSGYTLSNGQCVVQQVCSPNSSTSCSITNGVGQKTCNSVGSAYGTCTATSCNSGYTLSNGQCVAQAPNPGVAGPVMGTIDEIKDSGGNLLIRGWACSTGYEPAIAVHLYAGGPAGSGTIILGISAEIQRESAVGSVCKTFSSKHGFEIFLTPAQRSAFKGKAIYIHGIHPTPGGNNPILNKSGSFLIY